MSVRRLSLLLAIIWMALLFYLSHQPGLGESTYFTRQDKLAHAFAYGLLALFLLGAQQRSEFGYRFTQIVGAIALASLYGVSDEFHQSFINGRSADPWDWVADTLGATIATFALARYQLLRSRA